MKILIVVNNLAGGGAEKVAVDLANYFNSKNDVAILTLSDKPDKFIIDPSIKREKINLKLESKNYLSALITNFSRIYKLRKAILNNSPDIVISFMNRTNIRVLLSLLFTNINVIITEHNYPRLNKMNIFWEFLRKITYKRAKYLVSVSKGISECFKYLPSSRCKVIYNPVEVKFNKEKVGHFDFSKNNITAMGRLVHVKGFDLLIKAFAEIAKEYPGWNLNIIGNGSDYTKLEKLINDNDIASQVHLLGFQSEPHQIIKDSDIFVLSSRNEGFGNVIIEAMMCGTPVVATNCPVGPKEIIVDNETGILVENENVDSIKSGLEKLIVDEKLRTIISQKATDNLYKFSSDLAFEKWNQLIMSCREK